jgi:hypothetical protein
MLDLERLYPLLEGEPETPAGGEGTPPEAGTPDGQGEQPEAPKPEEKTLTQSEVNALIAREKKKAEKSAREAIEAERKKAEMSEAEKLKADLAERDKEIADTKAEVRRERSLRQLTGKVVDDEDALAIAERLQLVDEDGKVDLEALLKVKPYLAPQASGPTPTSGAGGTTPKGLTAEKLKSMDSKEFAEIQKRVQAGERVTL